MTRLEHIEWCKERAKHEIEFYKKGKEGIISMMSDLGKHEETKNHPAIQILTLSLLMDPNMSINKAIELIDGFR